MRFRPEQYDSIVRRLVVGTDEQPGNPNMLVPWYLMASYAYEELDDPFLSDAGFDWICSELDARWDSVEHRHKHLVDRAALKTSTGSYLVGKLPTIVMEAAKHLRSKYENVEDLNNIGPRVKTDIDDLLGTMRKVEQDVADLLGIPESLLRESKHDLADLL